LNPPQLPQTPEGIVSTVTTPQHELLSLKRLKRRRPGLIALNVFVIVVLAALLASVTTNTRFEWGTVATYFFEFRILNGIGITLFMTFTVMVIAIGLGTIVAVLRMSSARVVSGVAGAFIWIFRSIPMLVLLLFAYNLAALYPTIGGLDTNKVINPLSAALVALSLHQAAYVAELVRAGLLSIAQGQHEAAAALGLSNERAFFRIILPQAMRVIVPPMGNEVISLLKATSLVSVISLSDLLYSVQLIYAKNYQTIPLLIVACLWYMIITGALTMIQQSLERRLSKQHRAAAPAKAIEVLP
jgi:polar amino acid transport system permease protein